MSRIRSKNTRPEILVRKFLFANGFRFRVHVMNLPGKPDIVLPRFKTVIFVNGCFWHGHQGCSFFKIPSTRTDWWKSKIERNTKNDIINLQKLEEMGYKVVTIWECELNSNDALKKVTDEIRK